jgi:uncharacterized protein DUF4349
MKPIHRLVPLVLCFAAAACSSAMSSPTRAASSPGAPGRSVVQQAGLSMVSEDLAALQRRGDSLAVSRGGFVEDSELVESSLRMTLRVPPALLNQTMDELGAMGEVRRRTLRRSDNTGEVEDLQARLETLRGVRDRLRAYLAQSAAVADLVAVERELGRVQGEIDALEARQRVMLERVELAVLRVDAHRPIVLGPLGWIVTGLGSLIAKLFVIRE